MNIKLTNSVQQPRYIKLRQTLANRIYNFDILDLQMPTSFHDWSHLTYILILPDLVILVPKECHLSDFMKEAKIRENWDLDIIVGDEEIKEWDMIWLEGREGKDSGKIKGRGARISRVEVKLQDREVGIC